MEILVIYAIYASILSVIVAGMAGGRDIGSGEAFIMSLLFSPFVGIIAVYLSPKTGRKRLDPIFEEGHKLAYIGKYDEAIYKYKEVLYEISQEVESEERKRERVQRVMDKIREVERKKK